MSNCNFPEDLSLDQQLLSRAVLQSLLNDPKSINQSNLSIIGGDMQRFE